MFLMEKEGIALGSDLWKAGKSKDRLLQVSFTHASLSWYRASMQCIPLGSLSNLKGNGTTCACGHLAAHT
jgi:hypothetical protein